MKTLLILRHAEAAPARDGDDFERALTRRGVADAEVLGTEAARHVGAPALALVSPARRAMETFEAFSRAAGWQTNLRVDDLLYEASPDVVRDTISAVETTGDILVVGHNPALADLVASLAGGGNEAALAKLRRQFPAPCLAVLRFDDAGWTALRPGSGSLLHLLTSPTG